MRRVAWLAVVCVSAGCAAPAKDAQSPSDAQQPTKTPSKEQPQPGYQQAPSNRDLRYSQPPPAAPGGTALPPPAGGYSDAEGSDSPTSLAEWNTALGRYESQLSSSTGDCATACRALTSMTRAKERICALTGPDDRNGHCARATARLRSAEEQVTRRCGQCTPIK